MPKIVKALSWMEIVKLAKTTMGKRNRINVGGVKGLYADLSNFNPKRTAPHGIRFFMLYRNKDGKDRNYSLTNGISLSDARNEAQAIRIKLDAGIDPLEERKIEEAKAQEAIIQQKRKEADKKYTFRKATEEFLTAKGKEGGWSTKEKYKEQQRHKWRAEKYIFPKIGDLPLNEITPSIVAQLLKPLYESHPDIAKKSKRLIKQVYLRVNSLRADNKFKNPICEDLDVLTETSRKNQPPSKNRGAVPFTQITDFIESLLSDANTPSNSRLCLVFSILTASRSKAVRNIEWNQIDFKENIWNIPPKNDKPSRSTIRDRRIFLSSQALDLLSRMPHYDSTDLIFPSRENGSVLTEESFYSTIKKLHLAKKQADGIGWVDPQIKDKEGNPARVTQHGTARASFKTWAVDYENGNWKKFPYEISELCLLHLLKDPYRKAYRRDYASDESRRELMQAWGDYCMKGIDLNKYLSMDEVTQS